MAQNKKPGAILLSELAISLHFEQIHAEFAHLKKDDLIGNHVKKRILIELIDPENLLFIKK